MVLLHPSSLVTFGIPKIFKEVPEQFHITMKSNLKKTSNYAYEKFKQVRGVTPIKPSAAMYMMVKIDLEEFKDITDDIDFCKKLLEEECALVFPS